MVINAQHQQPHELLHAARGGDANALSALLNVYRNYLALLARIRIDGPLRAKADPSDLVQETCLQAFRDFPQFRGTTEAEFTQWLRTILAHNGAKLVRRFKGTQTRDVHLELRLQNQFDESSVAIAKTLASAGSSPSVQAMRREAAAVLADALTELPDDYREAIILHHLESLTIREVAQRMGRTRDSVKQLLPRAFMKLRKAMKDFI